MDQHSREDKHLDTFPGASREHARSIMEARHIPSENTTRTAYLTMDALPSLIYPGHPGFPWLSLAAESGVPASAEIDVSLLPHPDGTSEPLAEWSCVFMISSEDPDLTQTRTDDILVRYLSAHFRMSPSTTPRPRSLITDRNFLNLALSEAHQQQAETPKGTTPLLPQGARRVFNAGSLKVEVRVDRSRISSPHSKSRGLGGVLRAIRGR